MSGGGEGPGEWRKLLCEWPVHRAENWAELVNEPVEGMEMERLRESVGRGRPYGGGLWLERAVAVLGLGHTMRRPGRPRKGQEKVIL